MLLLRAIGGSSEQCYSQHACEDGGRALPALLERTLAYQAGCFGESMTLHHTGGRAEHSVLLAHAWRGLKTKI